MTSTTTVLPARSAHRVRRAAPDRAGILVLLAGFTAAVLLRALVGGPDVARSMPAGLVFAVALVLLVLAAGTRRPRVSRQVLVAGAAGGALICVPAVLAHVSARGLVVSTSTQGFLLWALVVAVVATAEEAFLRGALHDAVARTAGPGVAVVVGAAAFALLHLPLYGWSALPLDLAVGVVLGGLRVHAGSWAAPAVAHVGADLVSWFLR